MAGDDAGRRRADEPADLSPEVVVGLDRIQRCVRELVAYGVEHPRQRAEEVLVPVELRALLVVAERSDLGDGSVDVERLELAYAGNHEAAPVGHAPTLRSSSAVKKCAVLVFRLALELNCPSWAGESLPPRRRARE